MVRAGREVLPRRPHLHPARSAYRSTTSSLSGPSDARALAVTLGGAKAGIAPSATSPASASIFGPFAGLRPGGPGRSGPSGPLRSAPTPCPEAPGPRPARGRRRPSLTRRPGDTPPGPSDPAPPPRRVPTAAARGAARPDRRTRSPAARAGPAPRWSAARRSAPRSGTPPPAGRSRYAATPAGPTRSPASPASPRCAHAPRQARRARTATHRTPPGQAPRLRSWGSRRRSPSGSAIRGFRAASELRSAVSFGSVTSPRPSPVDRARSTHPGRTSGLPAVGGRGGADLKATDRLRAQCVCRSPSRTLGTGWPAPQRRCRRVRRRGRAPWFRRASR